MENMKAKRLAREHAQLILQRKLIAAKVLQTYKNARLPVTELLPEVMDFCEFPPIKVILEQPTEVTVDELSFSDALVLVPDLIKEWKTGITRQLITLMQKQGRDARFRASFPAWLYNEDDDYYEDSLTRDVDDEDIPSDPELLLAKLSLATTTFECTRCGGGDIDAGSDYDDFYEMPFPTTEPLYFPRALGHSCLTRTSEMPWVWIAPPPAEPVARLDHVDGESRKKLSTSLLVLNQCLGKCVASIVTAAGMDPATATVAEMNALDVSFACVHCAVVNGEAGFVTTCFGWHDAVRDSFRFLCRMNFNCIVSCRCRRYIIYLAIGPPTTNGSYSMQNPGTLLEQMRLCPRLMRTRMTDFGVVRIAGISLASGTQTSYTSSRLIWLLSELFLIAC